MPIKTSTGMCCKHVDCFRRLVNTASFFLRFDCWASKIGLLCFDSSYVLDIRLLIAVRKSSSKDLQYLTKSLRGNLRELGGVCSVEEHEDLLKDILEKTSHSNKEEATKAVKQSASWSRGKHPICFFGQHGLSRASVFAKRKSMTTGGMLGAAWWRLNAILDDLYPLAAGSKVSSSSSKPSLPVVKGPVATDVETKSKAEKAKRSLKKEDSAVTISSAVSEDDASQIQMPPKAKVSELYDANVSKTEYVYFADMGKSNLIRMSVDGKSKEPAVDLRPGVAGFLVAIFEDGTEQETEFPNALVKEPSQPVSKQNGMKRPFGWSV